MRKRIQEVDAPPPKRERSDDYCRDGMNNILHPIGEPHVTSCPRKEPTRTDGSKAS